MTYFTMIKRGHTTILESTAMAFCKQLQPLTTMWHAWLPHCGMQETGDLQTKTGTDLF
jgi:hypothetical protein